MKRLSAWVLLLIAVLLVATYATFPAAVRMLESALAAQLGLDELNLVVHRPELGSIHFEAVNAAAGTTRIELRDATLSWQWAGLIQGRADSLQITSARIRVGEDPDSGGPAVPALPFALSELPLSVAAITSLTFDMPHLSLHGTGQARLEEERLSLNLTATTPLADQPLELDFSLQTPADGRAIALDASFVEAGHPPLLTAQVTEAQGELIIRMDYRLYGFTLASLAQRLELPPGEGLLQGGLSARLALTPERSPDWQTLMAEGSYSIAWRSRDRTLDLTGLSGVLRYDLGSMNGTLTGAATYQADDTQLSIQAPADLRFSASTERLTLGDGMRIEARSTELSLSAGLRQIEVELGVTPTVKGLVDINSTAPIPLAGTLQVQLRATESLPAHDADLAFTGSTTLPPYPLHALPIDLRGSYRFQDHELTADLSLTSGIVNALPMRLTYDLNTAAGTLTADHSQSWSSPLLAGSLPGWNAPYDLDRGDLALRLALRFSETIEADLNLSLANTTLRYDDYLANRSSAQIAAHFIADGLSLAPSSLAIGNVDVGFPVTDIRMNFTGSPDTLRITDFEARLLGGSASAAPFDYSVDAGAADLEISLTDLDLAHVLALEGTDITGSGRLDGRLPIRVRDGEISMTAGQLEARLPGGRIHLAPSLANAISQPGLDIALRALEDFEFTVLQADADYAGSGDLRLGLRLEGRNARIEGGRPIHYNLNISENIPTLLESLRLSDSFTRTIQKRVLR